MSASNFAELLTHAGHDVTVEIYGSDDFIVNVAIECNTCYEIIMDFDNPDI